jgi:hypothetical protein
MKLKPIENLKYFLATGYVAQGIESDVFNNIGNRLFGRDNPDSSLSTSSTLGDVIFLVVQTLLIVAGSIAVIFLIVGGYKYIVARGHEDQVEEAKHTMENALWGLVVIIMSFAIIRIIATILLEGRLGI